MSALNKWLEYLGQKGIRYSHSVHAPAQTALETAAAERIPPRDLAKPVVYMGGAGFGMAVVAADELVDLPEVERLFGMTWIRLATEDELAELFPDCELGAMPPLGHLYQVPVLIDEGIAAREFIAFAIGTHRDVVRISVRDYKRLVKPLIASITLSRAILA